MFKVHRNYSLSTGVKNNSIAVVRTGNLIQVVYHETIVVEAKGSMVVLRNGGWDTISTRIVINRALEQLDGFKNVFLERVKGETIINCNGNRMPFKNVMMLDSELLEVPTALVGRVS